MIATLEAALEELENNGFIKARGYKREIFDITNAGYEWCDNNNSLMYILSELAKSLLIEATQNNKDIMLDDKTAGGTVEIGVDNNTKRFDRNDNKREIAQYRAAIQELSKNGLIEKSSTLFYTVTEKGYQLADEITSD